MNIEKLDTLLRNKLQWVESEVHENELNSVFEKMEIRKKKPAGIIVGGVAAILLCLGAVYFSMHGSQRSSVTNSSLVTAQVIKRESPFREPGQNEKVTDPPAKQYADPLSNAPAEARNFNPSGKPKATHPMVSWQDVKQGLDVENFQHLNLTKNALQKIRHDYQPVPTVFSIEPLLAKRESRSRPKGFDLLLDLTKPELSFWFSPMMSFEHSGIRKGSEEKVHFQYMDRATSSEKPVLTMNSGVKLQFKLFSYLQLGTGIGYFQTGNAYDYDYKINDIPVVDSASGRIVAYIHRPDSLSARVKASGKNISSYIEIPLSLRIDLYKNTRFRIGIEPSYALQIQSGHSGEHIDPVTLKLNGDRSSKTRCGNMQIGLPVTFMISNRAGLSLAPYYGRALQSVTLNNNENKQRTYAGIRFSFNYNLYPSTTK